MERELKIQTVVFDTKKRFPFYMKKVLVNEFDKTVYISAKILDPDSVYLAVADGENFIFEGGKPYVNIDWYIKLILESGDAIDMELVDLLGEIKKRTLVVFGDAKTIRAQEDE